MADSKCYVTFWGTRGSIPTPGRTTERYGGNTACISLRHGDTVVIVDAGTGIRNLGIELSRQMLNADSHLTLHLLLSHTHWDHIQGLPFFGPAYSKNTKLNIYGSPNKEQVLEDILSGQMDNNYFPVDMSTFAADLLFQELPEKNFSIDGITVAWSEQLYHPGGSVRFSFTVNGKKLVYASDVELERMFDTEDSAGQRDGEKYLEFITDADLLIADGQYTVEDYPSKVGWGHTSIPVLLDVAQRGRVKDLAVFHHEPSYSDRKIDELYVRYANEYVKAEPPMKVFWAREGLTLSY